MYNWNLNIEKQYSSSNPVYIKRSSIQLKRVEHSKYGQN